MTRFLENSIARVAWTEDFIRELLKEMTDLAALDECPSERLRFVLDKLWELGGSGAEDLCAVMAESLHPLRHANPVHGLAYVKLEASRAFQKNQLETVLLHAAAGRMIALSAGWELEASAACSTQGIVHLRRGETVLARRCLEEAIVAARRAGAIQDEARAHINLALALKNMGRLTEAEATLNEARDLLKASGNPIRLARCELNLSTVLFRLGRWAESADHSDRARSVFQELNLPALANTAQISHARALRAQGDLEEARRSLDVALAFALDEAIPRNVVLALEFLADCDMDEGHLETARVRLEDALIRARDLGEQSELVVECTRGMALVELAMGNVEVAASFVRESVESALQFGDRGELARSLLVRSEVFWRADQVDQARADAAEALQLSKATGERYSEARAILILAQLDQAAGELTRGEAGLAAAEALFRDLGLPPKAIAASSVKAPHPVAVQLVAGFLTSDPRVLRVLASASTLAPQDLSILILGESGTGKELVAQAIHERSGRKGPFVPVNCSAFPGDLIEGELFGHAKGAYTGADRERVGLFEYAHKGTLFLDEIGDMPLKAQARLLRVLENGEVRRLGENASRTVDVRIVAATHRHLMEMVGAGQFRLDLYYRIAGYVVELPPVRERNQDAKLLIDHFLDRFCKVQGKSLTLSPDLRHELSLHSWPGNVREIKMVMQRLVSLTTSGTIVRKLPFSLDGGPRPRSLPEVLEAEERKRILEALQTHNWNKAKAAITLGTNRTTLIGKMKRMGITLASS